MYAYHSSPNLSSSQTDNNISTVRIEGSLENLPTGIFGVNPKVTSVRLDKASKFLTYSNLTLTWPKNWPPLKYLVVVGGIFLWSEETYTQNVTEIGQSEWSPTKHYFKSMHIKTGGEKQKNIRTKVEEANNNQNLTWCSLHSLQPMARVKAR